MCVKALRHKLEQEATERESNTQYVAAGGKSESSSQLLVPGVERSVLDLQYLFTEGTESPV